MFKGLSNVFNLKIALNHGSFFLQMKSIFQNEHVFISCQEALAKTRFKSRNRKQSLM